MNPRRVHELMRQNFPERPRTASDWVVASDGQGLRVDVLRDLLRRHIPSDSLIVQAHRKAGDLLPFDQAIDFVSRHVGASRIRLSDRNFTGFVVVEANGVASGWSRP
jgi:hypothetical protein